MKMMRFAETQGPDFCISWCEDGRSFVITNCDEFTRTVVPKYFKPTKFSSFTRKLYRWGFRQINRGLGPDDPVIFGCAHFQRDAPEEMAHMRSITAAGNRKDIGGSVVSGTGAAPGNGMDPIMIIPNQGQPMMSQQPAVPPQQQTGNKRSFEDAMYQQQEESLQKRMLLSKLLQQQTMMQQSGHFFGNLNPNSALAMASMQHHHRLPGGYAHHYHHYHNEAQNSLKPAAYHHYMAQQQQQQQQAQPQSPTFGEPARTAEIVNAAIAALRNA